MVKITLALFLLLAASVASAADLTVSCVPPTKNTDGSSIPTTAVMTFNLYGALQGQPKVLLAPSPLATCTSVRTNVNPGSQCYEYTATVGGIESDHSVESCKAVLAPKPAAPGAPTITLNTTGPTAYVIEKSKDRFVALPAGTLPVGTPCDATQPVLGFYAVPSDAVKWSGTVRSLAVVASCG